MNAIHNERLKAGVTVTETGEFEILVITEGQGNGWQFSADVLRASLPLWNGVNSYLDHPDWLDGASVMRLGGVIHSPTFDEAARGVRAKLRTCGPCGPLYEQLRAEWLTLKKAGQPAPNIGFSADISFKAKERNVTEITRVRSADLVVDPARGGVFIAALQNQGNRPNKESHMQSAPAPSPASTDATATAGTLNQQLQDAQAAIEAHASVQTERARLAEQTAQAEATLKHMCAISLEAELTAARLPKAAEEIVRSQFAERVFKPEELTAAIAAQRKLVAELTANQTVFGPVRVSTMFSEQDQLQAAVDDLFEVERDEDKKKLKTHRLTGIRELYLGLTADYDFHGVADYRTAQFQHTAASFPGLVKNAMNKALIESFNALGRKGYDWWQKIAHVEHFTDLKQVTWLIFGTIGDLPAVADGAEYTEFKVGDGAETSNFVTYGGYVGVTRRAIINDDTRKLRAIPRELGKGGIRNISRLVAAIFTDNSAVGPTLADGGALFNATAVTTAGGHANLLTTALGTTYTAWDAAASAVYNQPMLVANETSYYGTGKKSAIDPTVCLVPRALKISAETLFIPRWEAPRENIQAAGGETYGGYVMPLTVPEWTDATDWAAVCDPLMIPGVCVGEVFGVLPEIFFAGDERDPAMFANDEMRIKVRHEIAVGVSDFRGLHKSNVAG